MSGATIDLNKDQRLHPRLFVDTLDALRTYVGVKLYIALSTTSSGLAKDLLETQTIFYLEQNLCALVKQANQSSF